MKPILFPSNETAFTTNGIGKLSDAISCSVTEDRNGGFELEMRYPVSGIHYVNLEFRAIIYAMPSPNANPQPFRIYKITKPMNGIVTVYAAHISYDLSGVPVSAFEANSVNEALLALTNNAVPAGSNNFTFWTDKTTLSAMKTTVPKSCRSLLGGSEDSILDIYGGEYEFNLFTVKLWAARGSNRGVSIRYGKNLMSLEQEENCTNAYTGILPYWTNGETTVTGDIQNISGNPNYSKILPVDLSDKFTELEADEIPEAADLIPYATAYIEDNDIGVPAVNLSISFINLEQTEEYRNIAPLEEVKLCDTVSVEFPMLGVSATAKCVRTVFDVLLEKYDSMDLNDLRSSFVNTFAEQQNAIRRVIRGDFGSYLKGAIEDATDLITGARGGYVMIRDTNGDGKPDEILIMDKSVFDPEDRTLKLWRWNHEGLGYSSTGYGGPFHPAMLSNGAINADMITTGALSAAMIGAGLMHSMNLTYTIPSGTAYFSSAENVTSGTAVANTAADMDGTYFSPGIAAIDVSGTTYYVAIGAGFKVNLGMSIDMTSGTLRASDLEIGPDGRIVALNGFFSGSVNAYSGSLGCISASEDTGSVAGNLNVLGNLLVDGDFPKVLNTPENTEGIDSYDSGRLVTVVDSQTFGTVQMHSFKVCVGSDTTHLYDLLYYDDASYDDSGPASGANDGKTGKHAVRITSSASDTCYFYASEKGTSKVQTEGYNSTQLTNLKLSVSGSNVCMKKTQWYLVDNPASIKNDTVGLHIIAAIDFDTATNQYTNITTLPVDLNGWVRPNRSLSTVQFYENVSGQPFVTY